MAETENTQPQSEKKENILPHGPVSTDDGIERDTVYYYSREHRLRRASSTVRELNNQQPVKRGLLSSLFGSKGNVMLLASILLIIVMMVFTQHVAGKARTVNLGKNTVAVSIHREEGILILGVGKKAPKKANFYSGAVDISVSPVFPKPKKGEVQEVPPLYTSRVYFTANEIESFQITLPFNGTNFSILLKTDNEQKSFTLAAR